MLSRYLVPHFGQPIERVERLGLFIALAATLLIAAVFARTVAETLFLTHAGAAALPLYFVLLGTISIPAAALLARRIDRVSRCRLLGGFLLASSLLVVLLRLAIESGFLAAYFAVLIAIVLIEMLIYIQFWVLVADYFTSLEQKRVVSYLAIAMALGGMIGGAGVNLLAPVMGTANLLLLLPLLYLAAVGQLRQLERCQRPLEESPAHRPAVLGEVVRGLRRLIARFPVVGWLAAAGFLEVFLGGLCGFLVYSIYSQSFPDETRLAAFLGALNASLSLLEVILAWALTRPLIRRLGVGWMSSFFPLTTLASYAGLAAGLRLPTAVAVHINLDTLAKTVSQPVETLTFNAVPQRFLGRVRTLSEGLVRPLALAFGGAFLVLVQGRLELQQIAWIGLGLSLIFVVLGILKGRGYYRSLTSQLSERTVDLTAVAEGLGRLPRAQRQEIRALLASDDTASRHLGIELAARSADGRLVRDEILQLAPHLDDVGQGLVVRYLSSRRGGRWVAKLREQAASAPGDLRRMAIEALLVQRRSFRAEEILGWSRSDDEVLRAFAAIAARLTHDKIEADQQLSRFGEDALRHALRLVEELADPRLTGWLTELFNHPSPGVKRKALAALEAVAEPGDRPSFELARRVLRDPDPELRAGAVALLGRSGREALGLLAQSLEDPDPRPRSAAAKALGRAGEASLPFLERALNASRSEVIDAAISAFRELRTPAAEAVLFALLQRSYRRLERYGSWLTAIPDDPRWQALHLALEDADQRIVERALRVLEVLGYTRTLHLVRQVLRAGDPRLRANAVETLDALPHRRFIRPLIPLLERRAAGEDRARPPQEGEEPPLAEIAVADDRWICLGAITVLRALGRSLPEVLAGDQDPMVRQTVRSHSRAPSNPGVGLAPEEDPMSRLLLLKRVNLFADLSLDSLLALDAILEPVEYLADERIFAEGDPGESFYIIKRGKVSIRTELGGEEQELNRLEPGDYFGEMALFDDSSRSAAAVAASACTLLMLDRGRFHSLFDQLPRFGIEISRVLSARLKRLQARLKVVLEESSTKTTTPAAVELEQGALRSL